MQYFSSRGKATVFLSVAFALFGVASVSPAPAAPSSAPAPFTQSAPSSPEIPQDPKVAEQNKIQDQQPKLTEALSGFSDGYDLMGAYKPNNGLEKNSPEYIRQTVLASSGKLTICEFGKGYLRVFADYVYLPAERGATNSVSISLTTLNKTPLTFKSVIESQPQEVYSQRGQYFVTPFFALNAKSPLEVRLEQRQTRKAGTNGISFVQGLLSAAATVFTGGAASTISSLTNYARASSTLVGAYEANTTIADVNRKVVFDDIHDDQMTLPTARIAFFTRGDEGFDVVDRYGNHLALKESMPIKFEPTTFEDADLKVAGSQKSAYQFRLVKDGLAQGPKYYPTGKQAFVILRFQVYNAYPNATVNPDKVAGVHEHFRAMNMIYLDRMLNSSSFDKSIAVSTTPPNTAPAVSQVNSLLPFFNLEGKKLYTDLRTLADTGDVSLSDAAFLLDEFAKRADFLAENNQPDFLHNLALSLYLDEDMPDITYPRLSTVPPVAPVPIVPVPTTTATTH